MKNLIFIMSYVFVLLLSSCSSAEPESQDEVTCKAVAESTLIKEIQTLNDSLMSIQASESRISMTSVMSFCEIASADIVGAYSVGKIGAKVGSLIGPKGTVAGAVIGGLIGGVGFSYHAYNRNHPSRNFEIESPQKIAAAYISVIEDSVNISDFYPQKIKLTIPENKLDIQKIGPLHNLVLDRLTKNNLSLSPIYEILPSTECKVISSTEFTDNYYAAIQSCDFSDYKTYMTDNTTIGNIVMQMYIEILNTYPEKLSDVEFISNKYIELISKSPELTQEEKDLFYSAISVAASSFEYWEYEYSQTKP